MKYACTLCKFQFEYLMFELQCKNYKNATTAVNDKQLSKNGLYITSH
jgi:hypothetical protein